MRFSRLLFIFAMPFFACMADGPPCPAPPDAAQPTDGGDSDAAVLATFDQAARAYETDNGMPAGWADWMIVRKDRYASAYARARTDRRIRVSVSYDRRIAYDPPWASEQEHFKALERMAELAYPGWDFSFSADDPDAEFSVVLGWSGQYSYADGKTVYLIWEGIFDHEFGHLLGLQHHYAGDPSDLPPDLYPPGEGTCIMARDSVTWGPAEQFVLGLGQQRLDSEVNDAIGAINGRYPKGWPSDAAEGLER